MANIELCASSISSIIDSNKFNIDRIELCSEIGIGGVTPSIGFVEESLKYSKVPIRVLIRPRSGNFVYDKNEINVIKKDILILKKYPIEGFVIGFTDVSGNLLFEELKKVVEICDQKKLTFHRAFDVLKNPFNDVDKIIQLGFDTILTSGQKENVNDGLEFIKEIKEFTGGKINIMPGGGINNINIKKISSCNFNWIHLSSKKLLNTNKGYKKEISFLSQEIYGLDKKKLKDIITEIK